MARAATTVDVFNAVAEPRRRALLDLLAAGERPVGELARALAIAQPQVSKHLRVLREVGAVAVRDDGRRRLYRVDGRALKPIHDWVRDYERLWSDHFDALDVKCGEGRGRDGPRRFAAVSPRVPASKSWAAGRAGQMRASTPPANRQRS